MVDTHANYLTMPSCPSIEAGLTLAVLMMSLAYLLENVASLMPRTAISRGNPAGTRNEATRAVYPDRAYVTSIS